MASHHFIGNGLVSRTLVDAARDTETLVAGVTRLVRNAGLEVVAHRAVDFENDGLTVVWVLAESHLVLHHWGLEGYATLDLHVCDYQASNAAKAQNLVAGLTEFCFQPGTETWREIHLEAPATAAFVAG